jgi:hypothetical protein
MLEVLRDNIVIMFLDEFSNSQFSYRYKGSRSNRPQFKIIEELKLSSKYSYVLYQ